MDLPKNEAVMNFEHVGDLTGRKYDGTFTVLCVLNMAQKHWMELEKTKLLGDHSNPTDNLVGIAVILSTLRAKVTDGPEWWKQSRGADILDEDMLVALYNKVQEAEAEWRARLKDKAAKKAQEPNSPPSTL